jgi:PIN domain nuclease of toxin-antitoxin system
MGISDLIDTHILLWWLFDDLQLKDKDKAIIQNPGNQVLVSSATAWEIATKYRIGKLPEAAPIVADYHQILEQAKFVELPISTKHALHAGNLPIEHRDPFDRMLMAQAELENLPIITYDSAFKTGRIQIIN